MQDEHLLRYSRQILLPQIDIEGQEKLLAASVLIVGLGGLGSPAAMYLAAAGVGRLVLNDYDQVDLSNLQRQIIHGSDSLGEPKTASAQKTLERLNPEVDIATLNRRLEGPELDQAVTGVDLILDCSDNFATRFAVNSACVKARRPLVSGAAIRFEGQLAVFDPACPDSPCYNCLYAAQGELAESCVQTGVLAPLPGIIGAMQALEAVKLLTGAGKPLVGSLLLFDGLNLEWQRLALRKNPLCPTCGEAGSAWSASG